MARKPSHWMQTAVHNPGYLHRVTHTPAGQKIPERKIEEAAHSSNPHERHAAILAEIFAEHRGK